MRKPIRFKVDNDIFEVYPEVSVKKATRTFFRVDELENARTMADIRAVTNIYLKPKSRARFNQRLRDIHNPINFVQLFDILHWIWEQYGGRPTSPSPDYSYGLPNPDGGKKLMGNVLSTVWTFTPAVSINY